jgi:antitoxin PrlF
MSSYASTLTSKGQITIPSYIRSKLHLEAGQKLEFFIQGESFVAIAVNKSVKSLKGILPKPKISLSIEEMGEVIRRSYDRN